MTHHLHRLNQWHICHIRWILSNLEKRSLLSQFRQVLSDMIVDLSFILHVWHKVFSIRIFAWYRVMYWTRNVSEWEFWMLPLPNWNTVVVHVCLLRGRLWWQSSPRSLWRIDGLNSLEAIQFNHRLVAIYGSSVETCLESPHQRCLVVQIRTHNFCTFGNEGLCGVAVYFACHPTHLPASFKTCSHHRAALLPCRSDNCNCVDQDDLYLQFISSPGNLALVEKLAILWEPTHVLLKLPCSSGRFPELWSRPTGSGFIIIAFGDSIPPSGKILI